MKVLVACEYSGIVRDAFTERGHDTMSCDILPTENPGLHYEGDVSDIINYGWDLMVAHPPCTYICNSGVRWLHTQEGRWNKLDKAKKFFNIFLDSDIPRVCIENPIPHKYAELPKYTQIIQPWMFGVGETKATCLWLKGLPLLEKSNVVEGRVGRMHSMPPSDYRGKERSKTYQCIADAMASQWG